MSLGARRAARCVSRLLRSLALIALALCLSLDPFRVAAGGLRQPLPPDMIRVSSDGWQFVDVRGNRFTPFGCTYPDPAAWPPENGGERWAAGKTGPAVIEAFDPLRTDRHFQLLADVMHANVVRVFLSPSVFVPTLGRFDDIAFKRLDK